MADGCLAASSIRARSNIDDIINDHGTNPVGSTPPRCQCKCQCHCHLHLTRYDLFDKKKRQYTAGKKGFHSCGNEYARLNAADYGTSPIMAT